MCNKNIQLSVSVFAFEQTCRSRLLFICRKEVGSVAEKRGICHRTGCRDVVVSEQDLSRYIQNGYKVLCAYYDGKQHKNLYLVEDKMHFA